MEVPHSSSVVIALADHISSPTGQVINTTDWNQASLSAANLLYQGYGSYPKGTYKNFVFPNLEQSTSNITLPTGAKLLNASSLDVSVGVIMSNITCSVLDPDGFRYTVGLNGSNDPEDMNSDTGWFGGSPGDYWLNLTHADFAGYRCQSPGPHCANGIVSMGADLGSDGSKFSFQKIGPNQGLLGEYVFTSNPWADPSAWPNGDTLRQAIALRNETTYVDWSVAFF